MIECGEVQSSATQRGSCDDGRALRLCCSTWYPQTMCLLSGWYVASENEEPKFLFYLILANLDLSIHSWLVANVLDNTGLELSLHYTEEPRVDVL